MLISVEVCVFVVDVGFTFFHDIVFTLICFVKRGGGYVLLMLFAFIYYDQNFCYPISQESISWELATCRNINPQSLEVFHILLTVVYSKGQQHKWISQLKQQYKNQTESLKWLIDMYRINDKYAQWGFIYNLHYNPKFVYRGLTKL